MIDNAVSMFSGSSDSLSDKIMGSYNTMVRPSVKKSIGNESQPVMTNYEIQPGDFDVPNQPQPVPTRSQEMAKALGIRKMKVFE